MVYSYKQGSHFKVPAQVAGEVCESLAQKNELTPKKLVDVSRPEDAPLHNEFEWDDATAAEAYREAQGGHIIRCIVTVPSIVERQQPARAFVRVESENTGHYTPLHVVCQHPEMMNALLEQARQDMKNFIRKYNGLKELRDIVELMEEKIAG